MLKSCAGRAAGRLQDERRTLFRTLPCVRLAGLCDLGHVLWKSCARYFAAWLAPDRMTASDADTRRCIADRTVDLRNRQRFD